MFRGLFARVNSRAVGLRMARRNVSRNKVQSILIILVIAMPVALASFGFTFRESSRLTPEERATYYLGQTQVKINQSLAPSKYNYQNPLDEIATHFNPNQNDSWNGTPPDESKAIDLESLIDGYTWLSERSSTQVTKTEFGQTNVEVIEVEAWDDNLQGVFFDFTGTVPSNENEALVNKAALKRLGVTVGGLVEFIELGRSLRIVGTIEDARSVAKNSQIFVQPGAISATGLNAQGTSFYGIGPAPTTWKEVIELNKQGYGILSREVIFNPPAEEDIPLVVAGGGYPGESLSSLIQVLVLFPILLMPVIVLTGSAFSFGARRQLRSIAVMSSLGANRSTLRFITIASGLWLGLLGGVVGSILGAAGSFFLSPSFTDGSKTSYPGFHVPWLLLGAIALGGAVIGGLVSAIPAFRAAKVDVLSTLRGSRRDAKVKKRSGIFGLVLIALGVAGLLVSVPIWVYLEDQATKTELGWERAAELARLTLQLSLLSSMVTIVGMMIGSSWLLVFARFIFKRIGLAANFATNDLVFNRKRFTAVISSVIATSFVAALVLSFYYTLSEPQISGYKPSGEVNQLQTSGFYPSEELKTKEDLAEYIAQQNQTAEQAVKSANQVAPVASSSVINVHKSFESIGYRTYDTGELILGAEGQIPYAKIDYSYLCPGMSASPDSKKLNDAYTKNNWKLANEISSQEKYSDCDRVSRSSSDFFVATPKELRVLLGGRVDAAAEDALAKGNAVVFNKGYLTNGKLQLDWYPSGITSLVMGEKFLYNTKYEPPQDEQGNLIQFGRPSRVERLSAVLSSSPNPQISFVIPPQTANRLGIDFHPMMAFVNFAEPLTQSQKDMLPEEFPYGFQYEEGPTWNLDGFAWLIALIAGLFVLASTAIALGLSQIESRADHSTLWSVGASKLFRSRAVSFQALTLSLLGTVCGSTVGFLLVFVLSSSLRAEFQTPLPQSLFLIVGIPLIAAVGFLIGTPKRYKFNPRLALD